MSNMPTFLVFGASRSGTTALYNYLKQHPMVFMSPSKEPNFFAFDGETPEFRGPGADYVNNSITDLAEYQALFDKASIELARGEASPLYLYFERAPKRIHHHIPNAKLIAVLRNPVDQAFSHFLYAKRQVLEPLEDFSAALSQELKRIDDHWQPMFHYSQFPRYHEQLSRYFALFPAEQIEIFLYEDFVDTPLDVLAEIFAFIGVDDTFVPDLSYRPNVGGVPKNSWIQNILMKSRAPTRLVGALLPDGIRNRIRDAISDRNLERPEFPQAARDHLIAELRDDILQLENLINRDLSTWLK